MTDGNKPFPANKPLQAFTPFIGSWHTTGSHPMIPGELHGVTTFEWHEAGAFVIVRSTIDGDTGVPDGLAIIGADETNGTYTMLYYDERGVSRIMQVSLQNNVLKWWRDAPEFAQRYSMTVSADGHTIVGKGEMRKDPAADWEPDLDLTYTRAS